MLDEVRVKIRNAHNVPLIHGCKSDDFVCVENPPVCTHRVTVTIILQFALRNNLPLRIVIHVVESCIVVGGHPPIIMRKLH